MAIGERIKFFRNLHKMTQKQLGQLIGFPESNADVRLAQYENGARSPKKYLTEKLAEVLGVSPLALDVPEIDSYLGLIHTLFALEDLYGLTVEKIDDKVQLHIDESKDRDAVAVAEMLSAWADMKVKLNFNMSVIQKNKSFCQTDKTTCL
ncbi:MAG: helix-turn-helix transcriptional regulator [Clostridia bacterium]|nr:helix-turn-helix transcriptional regulator [Clostridia bacterium]